MKIFLICAIIIFKCSNHFSNAEYDFKTSDDKIPSVIGYVPEDDDYSGSGLVFQFRRSIKSDNTEIEARRRSALDKNFMRFGRSDNKNLMRFGRSDKNNLMRFGRANNNLMRFGRADKNFMRFGRHNGFVRLGRSRNMMRFGRSDETLNKADMENSDDIEKEHEDNSQEDEIKRASGNSDETAESSETKPQQIVYYRRDTPKNLMRFGRAGGNLMRFGRGSGNLMRFGRAGGNLMRFGRSKMDKNFIRFGRSDKIVTKPSPVQTEIPKNTINDVVEENGEPVINSEEYEDKKTTLTPEDEDYELQVKAANYLTPIYVVDK